MSALTANLAQKGENSYYYAHKQTAKRDLGELEKIVADINKLEPLAETSFCKRMLSRERDVLDNEITKEKQRIAREEKKAQAEAVQQQQQQQQQKDEAAQSGEAPPAAPIAYGKVASYSWDQSEKFVSIYISWKGIGSLPAGAVTHEFLSTSFQVQIRDEGQGSKELSIPNLCHPVDTEKSKVVTKADRIVLKLKKQNLGTEWSDITDTADKKKAERDKRIEKGDLKGADTNTLLADMFANASDEDRAGLLEAAHKGRQKREGDAGKA
jgi:hypothetical protein